MQAKNIKIGVVYNLTLGRNEVQGEVIGETENGWEVRLLTSEKVIKVNSPDRFLRKARTIQIIDEPVATIEAEPTPETQIEVQTETAPEIETPITETANTEAPKKKGTVKGQMSGLDAAARVLTEDNTEMNVRQIAEAAIERGYWSPEGATPAATISSGIQREIRSKGTNSRFLKVGKGLFATYAPKDEQNY